MRASAYTANLIRQAKQKRLPPRWDRSVNPGTPAPGTATAGYALVQQLSTKAGTSVSDRCYWPPPIFSTLLGARGCNEALGMADFLQENDQLMTPNAPARSAQADPIPIQ